MARPPGHLTPAAARAHRRLADALAELTAPLPCQRHGDALSDDVALRQEAAEACPSCPLMAHCAEAGEHEQFGVWAGIDRTPITSTARKEVNRA